MMSREVKRIRLGHITTYLRLGLNISPQLLTEPITTVLLLKAMYLKGWNGASMSGVDMDCH